MATDNRPVPLPGRDRSTGTDLMRRPSGRQLPPGAVRWARMYEDSRGQMVKVDEPVPVDDNDRRTPHLRYTCKGHIDIGDQRHPCDVVEWIEPGEKKRFCPYHGCELTTEDCAPTEPVLPWRDMWKAVEPSARPLWVLLAEVAGGIGEQAAHLPATWPLLAVPGLAGLAYWRVRAYLTGRAEKSGKIEKGQKTGRRVDTIRRRARAAAYMGGAGGGWLVLAAALDPAGAAGKATWTALPLLWAVGAGPWWRYQAEQRNRPVELPTPTPAPVVEQPAGPDPKAIADAETWATDVAVAPSLQHTYVDVDTWQTDPGGRRMVIRAKRGAITEEAIRAALPSIAGAFDVKKSAIGWVEEYEGSPRSALLLVQPNSPLNEQVPGKPVGVMSIDDAVVHMGMKIDGTDLVTRLWTPRVGAPSRLIIGTKASGKTGVIRRLLKVMLQAQVLGPDGRPVRLVAPFVHDPKIGADYGAFRRLVSGFSIDSATLHMIVDAVIREMDRRYSSLATNTWQDSKGRWREGERPWDPATMGPIISLFFDEFHVDAKDAALMAKLEPFARKMRAAGIEVNFATHLATIGDTGSQGVRDMAAGGEAWILRTTLGMNAALATGGTLAGDPRALPRIPGQLYQSAGDEIAMQARGAWDDPEDLYDELYDDDGNPRILPVQWPQETLDAFGPDFVEWMHASQNRAVGSSVPAVPKALGGGLSLVPGGERDIQAEEALRRILFEAPGPMQRKDIAVHPLWAFGVTSTLTAALREGQDAPRPWLNKASNGRYELAPWMRQQMTEARNEEQNGEAA